MKTVVEEKLSGSFTEGNNKKKNASNLSERADKEMSNVSWPTMWGSEKCGLAEQ